MYFFESMPQNNSFNPAIIPEMKFHIGLPVLGGISEESYNSGFTYNELDEFIQNLEKDGYNPEDFIKSIGERNTFITEARANLLSFGFKIKDKAYFAFDLKTTNYVLNDASPEVAYLFANEDEIPNLEFPIIIDQMDFLVNSSINMGITYSRVINENLTIGVRPNINFNILGLTTSDFNYIVNKSEVTKTFPDYIYNEESGEYEEFQNSVTYSEYNETFTGNAKVGMPVEMNPEAINNGRLDLDKGIFPDGWEEDLTIRELFKNATLSLDIGACYQIDKWVFSASLLNLGNSKWRTYAYELDGVVNDDEENIYITEKDEVKIGLPTKFFVGAKRQFSAKWNYGILLHNTFYSKGSQTSATVSLNGFVGSALSVSTSYTAGYNYNNLGLGLRLRFLPGTDLFFVTDNVIQLINYKNAHRLTAAVGINMAFGTKRSTAITENL